MFLSAFQLLPTAPFHILSLGGSNTEAGLFLGFLTYSSAASAPITGALGDRWGKRNMLGKIDLRITTLPDDLEASARGAAMCALVSAGIIDSFDDVDDLTADAAIVEPDAEEARRYHAERERAMRLQDLLYPGTSSWDQML